MPPGSLIDPAESTVTVQGTIAVAGDAFQYCADLAQVTPNVTEIGGFAFMQSTSLTEIALPPNLTKVGRFAFHGGTSLRASERDRAAAQPHRDWRVCHLRVHVLDRDCAAAQPRRDWTIRLLEKV